MLASARPAEPRLLAAGLAAFLLASAAYGLAQRLTSARAVVLPLSALDRAIPFWPASGWVYLAQFALLAAAFLSLPTAAARRRFIAAGWVMQALAIACFLGWPVRFPRELFNLPADTPAMHAQLVDWVRGADQPVNCLPSLHAANAVLCVAALARGAARRWWLALLPLALACIVSTLTFKQHYVADVVAGLALGAAVSWFFWRRAP
ncbi:phosphatase PAP2 family protein [Ottowia testudinis]|uniref:Phosphatase PAP2 family protein n=1 Tax=Ottowia testudinis TaxID=2816950 RepID=A0A975CL19_9BURK|nr:phosphatase PAP2 family protein [Ottowia testudinis]QTD45433.1 phosphatase PAP2 family protein [Ottowia testudinis]